MRIHLHCPINPTGVGVHMQYLVEALIRREIKGEIELEIFPRGMVSYSTEPDLQKTVSKKLMTQRSINPDVIVIADVPSVCGRTLFGTIRPFGVPVVAYTVFETENPDLKPLRGFDAIWVPSEWAAGVVKKCLGMNALVVPEGVSPWLCETTINQIEAEKVVRVGSVGKFEVRKGQDLLLEAAVQSTKFVDIGAFWHNPWAPNREFEYLRKTGWIEKPLLMFNCGSQFPSFRKGNATVTLMPRTDVLTNVWSMLSTCDMVVFPHRGEGWGLPILESIACGFPTAATNSTGPKDYLGYYYDMLHDNHLPWNDLMLHPDLPSTVFDPPFFDENSQWFSPTHQRLVDLFEKWERPSYRDLQKYKDAGRRVQEKFSWEASSGHFVRAARQHV